jgi:hypothetical protein
MVQGQYCPLIEERAKMPTDRGTAWLGRASGEGRRCRGFLPAHRNNKALLATCARLQERHRLGG